MNDAAIELLYDYVAAIDEDRLEDWLDFFAEDAVYQIVPRENVEQSLPASLMLCTNKDMLRDRIVALRSANKFNLHYPRHVVSAPRVRPIGADRCGLTASYAVFQTNMDGESRLFSVGQYRDEIRFVDGKPLFQKKLVVVDSFNVPSMLAVPI